MNFQTLIEVIKLAATNLVESKEKNTILAGIKLLSNVRLENDLKFFFEQEDLLLNKFFRNRNTFNGIAHNSLKGIQVDTVKSLNNLNKISSIRQSCDGPYVISVGQQLISSSLTLVNTGLRKRNDSKKFAVVNECEIYTGHYYENVKKVPFLILPCFATEYCSTVLHYYIQQEPHGETETMSFKARVLLCNAFKRALKDSIFKYFVRNKTTMIVNFKYTGDISTNLVEDNMGIDIVQHSNFGLGSLVKLPFIPCNPLGYCNRIIIDIAKVLLRIKKTDISFALQKRISFYGIQPLPLNLRNKFILNKTPSWYLIEDLRLSTWQLFTTAYAWAYTTDSRIGSLQSNWNHDFVRKTFIVAVETIPTMFKSMNPFTPLNELNSEMKTLNTKLDDLKVVGNKIDTFKPIADFCENMNSKNKSEEFSFGFLASIGEQLKPYFTEIGLIADVDIISIIVDTIVLRHMQKTSVKLMYLANIFRKNGVIDIVFKFARAMLSYDNEVQATSENEESLISTIWDFVSTQTMNFSEWANRVLWGLISLLTDKMPNWNQFKMWLKTIGTMGRDLNGVKMGLNALSYIGSVIKWAFNYAKIFCNKFLGTNFNVYDEEALLNKISCICMGLQKLNSNEFKKAIISSQKLSELYQNHYLYIQNMTSDPRLSGRREVIMTMRTVLTTCKDMIVAINSVQIAEGNRLPPFAVMLVGKPGIGKSCLTDAMIDIAAAECKITNSKYTLTPSMKFWDGMTGNENFLVLDDVYATTQIDGLSNLLVLLGPCDMVAPVAMNENRPTMAEPKFIIMTSNTAYVNAPDLTCPAALDRRSQYKFMVSVKPEAYNDFLKSVDLIKSEELDWNIYEFNAIPNVVDGVAPDLPPMNRDQFMAWYATECNNHVISHIRTGRYDRKRNDVLKQTLIENFLKMSKVEINLNVTEDEIREIFDLPFDTNSLIDSYKKRLDTLNLDQIPTTTTPTIQEGKSLDFPEALTPLKHVIFTEYTDEGIDFRVETSLTSRISTYFKRSRTRKSVITKKLDDNFANWKTFMIENENENSIPDLVHNRFTLHVSEEEMLSKHGGSDVVMNKSTDFMRFYMHDKEIRFSYSWMNALMFNMDTHNFGFNESSYIPNFTKEDWINSKKKTPQSKNALASMHKLCGSYNHDVKQWYYLSKFEQLYVYLEYKRRASLLIKDKDSVNLWSIAKKVFDSPFFVLVSTGVAYIVMICGTMWVMNNFLDLATPESAPTSNYSPKGVRIRSGVVVPTSAYSSNKNVIDVENKISENIYASLITESNGTIGRFVTVGLKDKYYLMPAHVFWGRNVAKKTEYYEVSLKAKALGINEYRKYYVSKNDIAFVPGKDIAVVYLERPSQPDITNHIAHTLLPKKDFPLNISALYYKDGTKGTIYTSLSGIEDNIRISCQAYSKLCVKDSYYGIERHEPGMSGGACISYGTHEKRFIGLLSSVADRTGYSTSLIYSEIQTAIESLGFRNEFLPEYSIPVTPTIGMAPIVAQVDPKYQVMTPNKTKLKKTPMYGVIGISGAKPVLENYLGDPLLDGRFKTNKHELSMLEPELLEEIVNGLGYYWKILIVEKFGRKPRILDMVPAILGDFIGGKSIDTSTSPGIGRGHWMYNRKLEGKKDYIRISELGKIEYLDPELSKIVYENIEQHKQLQTSNTMFAQFPKDELRVEGKPPRSIDGSPLEDHVEYRMLFGELDAQMNLLDKRLSMYGPGIDLQSQAGSKLAELLTNNEYRPFIYDVRGWDTTVSKQLYLAAAYVTNIIYSDSVSNQKARIAFMMQTCNAPIISGQHIIRPEKGMRSGFPGTAPKNTTIHLIVFFYCVAKLYFKRDNVYPTFNQMIEDIFVICYADDIAATVRNPLMFDILNGKTLAKEMTDLGFEIVDPRGKTNIVEESIPHNQINFLKHTPIIDENLGRFIWRIDLDSLLNCNNYTRTGDVREMLDALFYHAFPHGKEFYEDLRFKVNEALLGKVPCQYTLTFKQMTRRWDDEIYEQLAPEWPSGESFSEEDFIYTPQGREENSPIRAEVTRMNVN